MPRTTKAERLAKARENAAFRAGETWLICYPSRTPESSRAPRQNSAAFMLRLPSG